MVGVHVVMQGGPLKTDDGPQMAPGPLFGSSILDNMQVYVSS